MREWWNSSHTFCAASKIITWGFFLILLIWHITLISFKVNRLCIPGINSSWSWCVILLACCWGLYASILLRICISIYSSWVLVSSFLVVFFSDFGMRVMLASWNDFGSVPFISVFWDSLVLVFKLFSRFYHWSHRVWGCSLSVGFDFLFNLLTRYRSVQILINILLKWSLF